MSTKSAYVPTVDSATVEAYRAADKAGKAKIRTRLQSAMMAAVEALDAHAAADAKATLEACVAASKPAAEAVPVEVILANRAATLRAAADMIESGEIVPEGLDVSGIDYAALPEGIVDLESAAKMASAKITRSGDRHSISEVIVRAFEGLPIGTVLRVSEIRARGAIEGYVPSPGAVANKITSGHPMIELVPADAEGPLRARKIA